MKSILALVFLLTASTTLLLAQKPAFYDDIAAFKKQDSIAFPPARAILFVGSSSFRMWNDLQDSLPGYTIINRGFGGSSLRDVIRYERDIIFPYAPKQVIIYCGENDIAADSLVTGKVVFKRFVNLYRDIKKNLPNVPVVYFSMKPSPSRWLMRQRMMDGNKRIKNFLDRKKKGNDIFIDVWHYMLNAEGKPMKDIFLEDKLHMNAKGYAIWQKLIQPYLLK